MNKLLSFLILSVSLVFMGQIAGIAAKDASDKLSSVKGKVFRGDKNHPVANALIVLLDEKKTNTVEARTDDQGNYVFESVVAGKYTVSIRTWYNSPDEVPCQLLMARTKDRDSAVMSMQDKDKYVEQVFIENFSVKAGKEISRDFDIACKSLMGG